MDKRDKKEQQRQYIERLLESDLGVAEWCERNGIHRQTMYSWLNIFAESEPELFGGKGNIADKTKRRWVESTRSNIKASKALASTRQSPGVIIVDTLFSEPELKAPSKTVAAKHSDPIFVELNGASVTIPPGSARTDISSVLEVVAGL